MDTKQKQKQKLQFVVLNDKIMKNIV